MNKQIIMASLRARPVRTAVSILAVALEVTLILVVVGLTTGITSETGKRVEGVGGDIMLQAPNSSIIILSSARMRSAQRIANAIKFDGPATQFGMTSAWPMEYSASAKYIGWRIRR